MRRERRRHEADADNHDRWLVSYADFITLLFAFFVVMYAISQVNEGKYKLLSDALTQAFKPDAAAVPKPPAVPDAVPHGTAPSSQEQMQSIAREVVNALGDLVRSGQVRVTESGLGVAVEINASVLFESGHADLMAQAQPVLESLARVLVPLPNDIQIEGHTDNEPIATPQFPSNWELSATRASSVVRLFNRTGIAAVRLAAVGYADTRNVADNDTPEGRARNRRVTVMILPERVRNSASVPASGLAPAAPAAAPAPAAVPVKP